MQITETSRDGLVRQFSVNVPAATVTEAYATQLAKLGKSLKIPGFRPGKVPASLLKQRYSANVRSEVLDQLLARCTQALAQEHKLRLAMSPKVDVQTFEDGKDFTAALRVEVFPEIPEVDLSGITLEKLTCEPEDAAVTEALERLARRFREREPLPEKGKAAEGDVVVIDFSGSVDGEKFEGGTAEKFRLELGSGQFIPGFEDQLIGVQAGADRTVKVTFPEDYQSDALAGKAAEFAVHVHEVLRAPDTPLDDSFAERLGMKGLEELRTALRGRMAEEYEGIIRNILKKQLFDKLDSQYGSMEVPPTLLEGEFDTIWRQLQEAKKQGDPSLQRPEEELREEYRKIAARRVRLGVILAELGRRHDIKVPPQKIGAAMTEQARQYPGQEAKVLEFFRNNPASMESIRASLMEEEVVDFILSKATVTETAVTHAQLLAHESDEEQAGESAGKEGNAKAKKAKAESGKAEADKDAKAKDTPEKAAAAKPKKSAKA